MSKILVTGGLGYIGSHTVVELLEQGYEVVVIDNLSNSQESVIDGIKSINQKAFKWYNTDINDKVELQAIFKSENIDAVIHFAAFKAVGESVEKPLLYFNNNVSGLINLLEVMQEYDVKSIVFSSSCTVYGDTKKSPITEEHPRTSAISPYGTTKIICEEILEDCARHGNFKVISLRYFNPVGAHPSAQIGELPIGVPNNLVPYICQTAAGIREKLTIFGNDYNTADGTNIRDFIHVVDLAKAHVKAVDQVQKQKDNFDIFNLGTGKGHSVLEVVKAFETANSLKLNYEFGGRRKGDVEQIWADASKAKNILGWEAELNLSDMMTSAWKWQQALDK